MPRNPKIVRAEREARRIYDLQMREAIVRMWAQGWTLVEIAAHLGQSVSTIRKYRKQSMDRAIERYKNPEQARAEDLPQPSQPPRPLPGYRRRRNSGPGPGPHVPGSTKGRPVPIPGVVLDAPNIIEMRKKCLLLRKAALPFDEIADRLGITETEARSYTADALRAISASESSHAEAERRLMVEQIDDMIRAIRPNTVGYTADGDTAPVILDAIDRMIRLMSQKAKLLGLEQLPATDIMARLQQLAFDGGYDMVEIEDIARDVLARHKFKMPVRFETASGPDLSPGNLDPAGPDPEERGEEE